jgi:hypothetical protein
MAHKLNGLAQQYVAALRKHLKQSPCAIPPCRTAQGLGRRAMGLGLETLDLARFHEQALITLVLPGYSPGTRERMVRRAGTFFAEAITPIEKTHRAAQENNDQLVQLNKTLHRRSVDLISSNRQLQQEIVQRKTVEASLRKSEHHYSELLEQSRHMQEQLRLLSRQLLTAQEEERKMISRELHDQIAQTLTGINIRLASLKTESTLNNKGLQKKISSTQQLYRADGRARSFDGLRGGGKIGHGQTNGALSRRPGSAHQCGPSCPRQPGGSEHPETSRPRWHENQRRRQIL